MTNLEILLKKRKKILALLESLEAEEYKLYPTADDRGLGLEVRFAGDHFESLGKLFKALRKLGITKAREHANGIEFEAFNFRGRKGTVIAYEIVKRFRRFFSFWRKYDKRTNSFEIVDEARRQALTKRLEYKSIELSSSGAEIIVDGLESNAPSCTIGNALDGLYRGGTDDEVAALLEIILDASRPRKRTG